MGYFRDNLGKIIFVLVVSVPVLFVLTMKNKERNKKIDNSLQRTCGTVVGYQRSGHSGTSTRYEYYVHEVRYEAYSNVEKRFHDCMRTGSCIGLRFTVEYEEGDPSNSRIMWDEPNCPATSTRKPE